MGNTIVPMEDGNDDGAARWMKAAGVALDWEHCNNVANAKDIDRRTYESRQNQDYLKPEQERECEKFRIQDTYGMTVTPELVKKDDSGRLIKKIIALEAILASIGETITDDREREFVTPPNIVADRDKGERERLAICTDWSNHSTSWLMRHRLGLRPVLMDLMAGVEVTGNEATVQAIANFSKRNTSHIKAILNLTIPVDESPMWILGQYLEQLGLSTQSRRPVELGKRVRYYSLNPEDIVFVQHVLDYRQRQRESRERKQQESQERNKAYAATMQAQYGIGTPSTPPHKENGSNNWGGMDGQDNQAEILNDNWWNRVKDVTSGERKEIDLLAQVRYQQQETYFLIHVENQSSTQSEFPKRMFKYFARLLEKYDLPIYPVVIFSFDEPLRAEPQNYRVTFSDLNVLEFQESSYSIKSFKECGIF